MRSHTKCAMDFSWIFLSASFESGFINSAFGFFIYLFKQQKNPILA